jgi:uncharacterized damage-inducible protein DinB
MPPPLLLDGLDTGAAESRVEGVSHSIAELVAHLAFWQEWFWLRTEGVDAPMAATAAQGWPAVAPGSWPVLRQRFLDALTRMASRDDLDRPLSPAIEFPPLAHYTVADAIIHVAQHNAHHLGQVVILRQQLAAWPPPNGSWTW